MRPSLAAFANLPQRAAVRHDLLKGQENKKESKENRKQTRDSAPFTLRSRCLFTPLFSLFTILSLLPSCPIHNMPLFPFVSFTIPTHSRQHERQQKLEPFLPSQRSQVQPVSHAFPNKTNKRKEHKERHANPQPIAWPDSFLFSTPLAPLLIKLKSTRSKKEKTHPAENKKKEKSKRRPPYCPFWTCVPFLLQYLIGAY